MTIATPMSAGRFFSVRMKASRPPRNHRRKPQKLFYRILVTLGTPRHRVGSSARLIVRSVCHRTDTLEKVVQAIIEGCINFAAVGMARASDVHPQIEFNLTLTPEDAMQLTLRQNAEEKLENGTAPLTRGWPTGMQAIRLLHDLASAPVTASDALKLLHELQVHQVELDLQHEQAEQDHRQLTEDITNYTALFDLAPFAYLALYPEGRLIAANRIAADWLVPRAGEGETWAGRHIEDLLAPECHAAVRDMLAALRNGDGRQTCAIQTRVGGARGHAVATATPDGARALMAFVPTAPVSGH